MKYIYLLRFELHAGQHIAKSEGGSAPSINIKKREQTELKPKRQKRVQ
jgi:hypothetical protein